jgi:hypothetical protein
MGSDTRSQSRAAASGLTTCKVSAREFVRICNPFLCKHQRRGDFTGDGKTDYAVFRPSTGTWFIQPNGSGAATGRSFGASGDKLQPVDYDGDGKTDIGFTAMEFGIGLEARQRSARLPNFGTATDIPVAGDYTGRRQRRSWRFIVLRPASGIS